MASNKTPIFWSLLLSAICPGYTHTWRTVFLVGLRSPDLCFVMRPPYVLQSFLRYCDLIILYFPKFFIFILFHIFNHVWEDGDWGILSPITTSTVPGRFKGCCLRHHFMVTVSCMWVSYHPYLHKSFFHVLHPLIIPEARIATSLKNRFLVHSFFQILLIFRSYYFLLLQKTQMCGCTLACILLFSGSGMFGKHTRFIPFQCSPDCPSLSTRDETHCNCNWMVLAIHCTCIYVET